MTQDSPESTECHDVERSKPSTPHPQSSKAPEFIVGPFLTTWDIANKMPAEDEPKAFAK
jgi:hypothetical protein